ncbi:MAG TPA: hypothetical protein VKB03_09775 [Conexibacter sp.]|nr:hypothetical protein [Conexibacter sp.]
MTSRSQRGSRATVAPQTIGERVAGLGDSRVVRALIAHPHLTAAGSIALVVLVYLWPALIGGGVLAPTALLSAGAPWRAGASPELLRYVNNELGDVPITYYPWNALARQFIHAGTFPAWNPHALAGTPLFANFEIAWLSPFSLPLWILPLNYGLGVAAALKLWMAGFGTYLLVRELRLGFWPAMVAAVSFTLCAFNVVWLTYGVFVSVAALLPWALWLTERLVRRGRAADGLWLALVVAGIATGGHPGTQVHVLAATALYALLRCLLLPSKERAGRVRSLALVGGALTVGLLLAAAVLLPAQQAAIDSYGAAFRRGEYGTLFESRVPFGSLRSALLPEWWGRPSEQVTGGDSFFRERTFYAGVIPLALAVLAVVSAGGWRRKAPFVLLAVLGAAVAVRTPLVEPLVRNLPLFDQVQNQRMLLWFMFGVSILSAFGLEQAIGAPRERRVWVVIGSGIAISLCAAVLAGIEGNALTDAAAYVVHRTDHAAPAVLSLASVAWALLLLLGLAAVLLLMRRRPRAAALACALLALLVAFDLLHFAVGYNPIGPASVVMPPRTPAIAYLQRHADEGRMAGVGISLPPDWSSTYGLRDVRGLDAPQPTMRFERLWQVLEPGYEPARLNGLSPVAVNLLGMLGARYIVADPETPPLDALGLRVAYRGRDAAIFSNELALPRAFVAGWVDVAPDDEGELSSVAEEGFDPGSHAIIRADELGDVAPPGRSSGTARVVGETNDSVTIRARLAQRGLVVLDDQWMPGWNVRVDGRPAPILQTDVVLRGVIVPAGEHEIVWSYRVPGLRAGVALSGLGLVTLLTWAGVLVAHARRRRLAAPRER